MTSLPAAARSSFSPAQAALTTDQALSFATLSHARACLVLVLLALACFLPGFASLQPMDRDEPRFAQASKQMLETRDLVDIRFQDEARHKKPVGIYWLQSGVVAVAEVLGVPEARTTIALYRLPSLLGAIGTVLATYWAALAFLGRCEAVLAASLMGASIILSVEARLAKTDAMLALCSVVVMGALARAYLARGIGRLPPATCFAFWAAFALGVLIKGPLVLLFAGLAAIVLSIRERSGRWLLALRPGPGLALTALAVTPWFVAITLTSQGAFFQEAVGHDMLGKVGTAQTQHWAPPGTYLLVFFATFWPAAPFAAMAVPFAVANRRDDLVAFLVAWVVPSWLVFEAVPTKLPHYVMPLFPALAILTLLAVQRGAIGPAVRRGSTATAFLVPFIPLGLCVGLGIAAWQLDGTVPWLGLAVLAAAGSVGLAAWRQFVNDDAERSLALAVVASILVSLGVFGLVQPQLRSLKVSPRLAEVAREVGCPAGNVATLGYREPSLVFLVGTRLDMVESGEEAAAFLAQPGCRLVFVERRFEPAFLAAAMSKGARPGLVTRVAGFNVNGGRRLDIGAYAVRP